MEPENLPFPHAGHKGADKDGIQARVGRLIEGFDFIGGEVAQPVGGFPLAFNLVARVVPEEISPGFRLGEKRVAEGQEPVRR